MNNKKDLILRYDIVQTLGKKDKYPGHANVCGPIWNRLQDKDDDEFIAEVQSFVDEYNSRQIERGEEPDIRSVLSINFEEIGIIPSGWNGVNPYDTEKYPLTQIGFSQLFADWGRGRLWYDPVEDVFYVRDNGVPQADKTGKLMVRLRAEFQENLEYAASLIQNKAFCKKFDKERQKYFREDSLWKKALTGVQPYCAIDESGRETPKYIIATQSQIITMNRDDGSITVREMTDQDFITRRLNTEYDPNADCPNFKKHLMEVFEGNIEKMEFFQMALGMGAFRR